MGLPGGLQVEEKVVNIFLLLVWILDAMAGVPTAVLVHEEEVHASGEQSREPSCRSLVKQGTAIPAQNCLKIFFFLVKYTLIFLTSKLIFNSQSEVHYD